MDKVTVRITTPVKTTKGVLMPGSQDVDPKIAEELAAAGVLETDGAADVASEAVGSLLLSISQDEIDQLVAARAKAIAEEIVEAVVKEALSGLKAERDAAIARAADAEARLAEIGNEKAADTPAAAPAAAPPKEGKAAKKG